MHGGRARRAPRGKALQPAASGTGTQGGEIMSIMLGAWLRTGHCECNGRSATCQRHRPRYVTHPLFPPPPSLPGPIAVRPLPAASPASATSPSLSLSSTTRRRFRPTSTALRLPSLLPASAAVPSAAMSSSVSLLWVRLELPAPPAAPRAERQTRHRAHATPSLAAALLPHC